MERVGVKEFRNRATQLVREVREHAARFVVTVDGIPAAILKPYDPGEEDEVTKDEMAEWLQGLDELADEIGRLVSPGTSGVDAVAAQRRTL